MKISSRLLQKILAPAFLIMAAFVVGFLLPYRVSAQDDCPTGTIGDCTELEIISSKCRGMCTIFGDPIGWYSVSCTRTVYQCYAPQVRRYTTGECGGSCFYSTE